MTHLAKKSATFIKQRCPLIRPKIGIILGSGLRSFVDILVEKTTIPYSEIPHFPECTIKGHSGNLHIGHLHDIPIACYEGRIHFYEGATNETIKTCVRTLKLIGCEILLVTNAAGSLNPNVPTGNLVLIKDHINFQLGNPLVGPNDDDFGPRFFGMEEAYDPLLRKQILNVAQSKKIPLTEGIFGGVLGPSFETPAEIRMFKTLGVDVVAMSLIPEVIVARHCDMRVIAISAVSNLAAGLERQKLSHEMTLEGAEKASGHLVELISEFFRAAKVVAL